MDSYSMFLPSYSIGADVYEKINDICSSYGKKIVCIGGKTAIDKAKDEIVKNVESTNLEILDFVWFGGESSYENVDMLLNTPAVQNADMIFAIGGGKAIDTSKAVASKLSKPLFAFPTIAATCAATSAICVMYNPDGTQKDVYNPDRPAVHVFINTKILAEAPEVYLWAGIGDTIDKHYAISISSRGDELSHSDGLALAMSKMCVDPLLKYGVQSYEDCKSNKATQEFQEVALCIMVTTGLVSNLVDSYKYNTCLDHSLTYGLALLPQVEEKHLHGECVSYCVLVLLMIDKQLDTIEKLFKLYKPINLPTKLSDLEVTIDELEKPIHKGITNYDVEHMPYKLTSQMVFDAIKELEEFNKTH